MDRDEFVKIFSGSIFEIFDLSKRARDLFRIILQIYSDGNYNMDKVYFNLIMVKEKYGYNRAKSTYLSALNEIAKKRFIAPVMYENNMYWINPNMFFKGDRMILIQDVVMKGSDAAKAQEKEIQNYQQLKPFDKES